VSPVELALADGPHSTRQQELRLPIAASHRAHHRGIDAHPVRILVGGGGGGGAGRGGQGRGREGRPVVLHHVDVEQLRGRIRLQDMKEINLSGSVSRE